MPTTPTLITHDLLLADYASPVVTLGLFIEKDKNGIPIFRRMPSESLSSQQFQAISQAIFPPQYQGFLTQNTWHGGFGKQALTGGGADDRYMLSHGVDHSVKGLQYPSPTPVATTNTTASYAAPTIINGEFEPASYYWTQGANWSDSAAAAHGGVNGELHAGGSAGVGNNLVYQDMTQVDRPLYVGLQITLQIWAKKAAEGSGAEQIDIYLQDTSGNTIATKGVTTVTTSWVQYTLNYTILDTNAVGLRFAFTAGGGTADIYVDDATLSLASITTGTAPNTIVKLIDFNSSHYAISDTGVWKRTAANWVRVAGSPSDIVDAESDGTNLYLVKGLTNKAWYMNTSEVFTRISSANSRCLFLSYTNGSMYGLTAANTLSKFTDITAGTVAASYTVGLTGFNCRSLKNHLEMPYVIYENWAGYLNTSLATPAIVEIASELRSMYNTNTGKNAISWRGNGAQVLYIPVGGGASLLAYDAGDVVNVGPDVYAERLSDFTGQIVATTSDDQWVYIVQDNSTKIEITKGRYETISGATAFRWHPIIEDTYATVGYAHVSSITAKRLYYGGGTALPKYIPLPTQYGDPLNDSGLTFSSAVTSESSWYDLNTPRISKTYLNCTVDSIGLSATKTIKIEYQLWESQGTWTELGGSGSGSFTTSPTETKTFAINIGGRKIRFRFTYTTDNTAVGYGMLEFTCRLVLGPSRLDIFTARVRVGNKNLWKNTGALDTEMTYSKVATQLHAWKHTQPLLLTWNDGLFDGSGGFLNGKTLEVKFMEGYPKEDPISLQEDKSKGIDAESLFDIALVSIDRSVS